MIIDWQHHLMPEPIWRARGGKPGEFILFRHYGNTTIPLYEEGYRIDKQLKDMDVAGIDMAVLSETSYTIEDCRLVDETYAGLMKQYPDRIVGLAPCVPLQGKEALDELTRAIKDLGLRGTVISPQRKGVYLDSKKMWPFYERVAELAVPIFVHISPAPRGFDALDAPYNLGETMAREFDVATAIARICIGGVLEDFPDLKFVMGHLGGGIAAIKDRIEQYMDRWGRDFWIESETPAISKPFSYYFNKIYIDTAGYDGRMNALKCALTDVSPKRILFGTDYPFDFAHNYPRIKGFIEDIRKLDLDEDAKEGILGRNAAELLGIKY